MIEAWIGQPLGFEGPGIGHHAACGQGFSIHHRHHPMDPRSRADFWPGKGRQKRFRQGKTTGFHHNPIDLVGPIQQPLHCGQEIVLDCATQAAIGQLHQPAIKLLVWAEAAATQEIAIDPHLAKLIHHHGEPLAAVEQEVPEQGGLAGPEKTCHHGDGQTGWGGQRHRDLQAVNEAPI